MNVQTPCVSFIGIVDFSQEAKWLYMTDSVAELLGFEPSDLIGRPSLELVHPDEFPRVKKLHYDTIRQDKAAVLVYLRMKHKDPYRGYVLCGVSRTVVHNVLVGSVSFAQPGAKAMHNASTAQEITVITPSAHNLSFRRWHDPSPMPPSPIPECMSIPASPTLSATSSSYSNGTPRRSSLTPRNTPRSTNGTGTGARRGSASSSSDDSSITSTSTSIISIRSRRSDGGDTPGASATSATATASGSRPGSGSDSPKSGHRSRSGSRSVDGHRGYGNGYAYSSERTPSPGSPSHANGHGSPRQSPAPGGGISAHSHSSLSPLLNHTERSSTPPGHRTYRQSSSPPRSSSRSPPPSPAPSLLPHPSPPSPIISFPPLPSQSFRTAFILDRFSLTSPILYCSNDLLLSTSACLTRSFFDYVVPSDERRVREWVDCVKGWGVNEKGGPSDGGFGFGRFGLCVGGRDSEPRMPEPPTPSRPRQGSQSKGPSSSTRSSRYHHHHHHPTRNGHVSRPIRGGASASASSATSSSYTSTTSTASSSSSAAPPASPASSGRPTYAYDAQEFEVDAIFSAHSDGLMVILRRAT